MIKFLAIFVLMLPLFSQAKEITPCKVRRVWYGTNVEWEFYHKTEFKTLDECANYTKKLVGETMQMPDPNWGGMQTFVVEKAVMRFNDGKYNLVSRITKGAGSNKSGCELKLKSFSDGGFSVFDKWFKVDASTLEACTVAAKKYIKTKVEYPTTTFIIYKVKMRFSDGAHEMVGRVKENEFFSQDADLQDIE